MRVSRIAGTLIIIGIIAGILSITPSIEGGNILKEVYPNRNQVLTAAIFQFLLVPIYIGFSLILHQILSKYNRTLSIGFVGFRMIAGVFQILGIIMIPLFILLSQKVLAQSNPDLMVYESIGDVLMLTRNLINHLGVILATALGNLLFYTILYNGKLIPIWLLTWGILGNILIILASFLLLFGQVEVVSIEYGVLTIPLVIQEVVLAVWLIVKGLNIES